jgi:hypothetical protein
MPFSVVDGSILDDQGSVLFYSADRFLNEIVEDDRCFICGKLRAATVFNDEHVIPDWLLRWHSLHDKRIVIPGESDLLYGRYKIPCCQDCNTLMARRYEEPMAERFAQGYGAVAEMVTENPITLFGWMNLLFLKVHLKDRTLLLNRDRRVSSPRISDIYDWPEMHHIHCVARMVYTNIALAVEALGSTLIFPAKTDVPAGDFDYADYYPGRAMLLRSRDTAVFCVLNDSCGALNLLMDDLKRITGPLGAAQCRELLAHFAYANMLIKERPRFHTSIEPNRDQLVISAAVPEQLDVNEFSQEEFGHIAYSVLRGLFSNVPSPNSEGDILEFVRQGRWTFLFDKDRRFIENSI